MEIKTRADVKQAIKALRDCAEQHKYDYAYTGSVMTANLCNDVAGYLEAQNPLCWHEYPSEKPSESGEYIVAIQGLTKVYTDTHFYGNASKMFHCENVRKVIAWMPMPEYTPKEK